MAHLIVITGSSGVGKSTLARALQEALLPAQWLHFSVDTVFYCLPRSVTSRVDRGDEPGLVDSAAVVASALACARTLLDGGQKVIFDAVIASAKGASGLLNAFAGHDPVLVELTCTWEEIERRTRSRGDRTIAEAEQGFRRARGHLTPHHRFDTTQVGAQPLAQQLAEALRRQAR